MSATIDTPDPAAPIETKVATLADLHAANAAAIATNATAIDGLETAHVSLLDRFENLASVVEGLAEKGVAVAETGILGEPAQATGVLVQEIVNFLHHIFPGHAGLPGTLTTPPPPAEVVA